MSLLEKNIDAIDQCIIGFRENYENEKKKEIHTVEVIKAKDKSLVLQVCLNNGKKICLSSLYQGKREIEHWMEQFEIKNNQVYIIFGLSNGEQIRELLKKIDKDSRIIIYEPSQEIFQKAIEEIDYTDLFNSEQCLIVVKGINQIQFQDIFAAVVTWSNRESVKYVASLRYEQLYLEEYKEFVSWIRDAQERIIIDRNTFIYFASASVDSILFNLQFMYHSYSAFDLKGKLEKNGVGIVVSSGPSLMKNIKVLKEAKGKAFILACDSAVKYLVDEGIVPDAFVTIDSMKKFDFQNAKGLHIPGFVTLSSSREITEGMDGAKIFYASSEGYFESICNEMKENYYSVSTGGSVACNAFDILRFMGCSTIVLVGQDLAFTNNKIYPGQEKDEIEWYQNVELEAIEDVYGNTVYSDRVFTKYRLWFEMQIEQVKGTIKVIDATEGGAKIRGSEIMSLREVIDTYCKTEYDYAKMIHELPIHYEGEERERYIQWLLKGRERLKKLEKYIDRAIDICNRFVTLVKREHFDGREVKKIVKELGTIVTKIEEIPEENLLDLYVSEARYCAMEQLGRRENTIEKEQQIVAERNLLLYKNMKESIKYLEEQYNNILDKYI